MPQEDPIATDRPINGYRFPVGEARLTGDTLHLTFRGELCMETGVKLRGAIRAVRERAGGHRILVIDLRELDAIDSFGVESLLQIEADIAAEGGRVVLHPGPSPVRRVFRSLGRQAAFEIAADRDAGRPLSGARGGA